MSSLGTPFTIPTFGDPKAANVLATTLIGKTLDLVKVLTSTAYFTPFTVAFPGISVSSAPVPTIPSDPQLDIVKWKVPDAPVAFKTKPPDISKLFPVPFTATPPTLNFGNAPGAFSGSIPGAPTIDLNFTYPKIDPIEIPPVPQLLNLNVIDFNPIDIPKFTGEVPVFTIQAPTPVNFTEAQQYDSELLDLIRDEMTSALTTDTDIGLSASVQQAMWDAAREREFRSQADALADLGRLESMGFNLPSGIYLDARLKIQNETAFTTIGLSRDIMVKQAELRLENVTKIREQAITLESQLITYANQIQQRAFESAKYQTEAMISIYNSKVQAYSAQVEAFKATIQVYETVIRGIEAEIEQLKARISYEQTKAQINETLVATYKAQIDAAVATLEVAKVQVQIIQTEAQVEKTKIDAYVAQIQGFVATVNAYTAEVEGYKANVEAQGVIESVYKTQVDAYTSQVQASAAEADTLFKGYDAQVKAYEVTLEVYKTNLEAMVQQVEAAAKYNQFLIASYSAKAQTLSSFNEVLVKEWEATNTIALQTAEVITKTAEANVQLQISQRQITEEAIKGATEVMAQLGAAALGAIHWSSTANYSDSASFNSSLSVSNSTSDDHIFSQSA